jgi:hypothetical protein
MVPQENNKNKSIKAKRNKSRPSCKENGLATSSNINIGNFVKLKGTSRNIFIEERIYIKKNKVISFNHV